jgi:MOB kinase activator 1
MNALFGNRLDKSKTFKPNLKHRAGTKRFELHKYAQATLGTGNLRDAVSLPEGEDENEWLAVNTVDFFNEINLLYGVIAEFCTEQACPIMCAGPKYEYMWADGQTIKRPMAVSAPRYVDYLMTWVQNQLDDEKIFPTQLGVPFPPDFTERVQNIFKRLFRVYAASRHPSAHMQSWTVCRCYHAPCYHAHVERRSPLALVRTVAAATPTFTTATLSACPPSVQSHTSTHASRLVPHLRRRTHRTPQQWHACAAPVSHAAAHAASTISPRPPPPSRHSTTCSLCTSSTSSRTRRSSRRCRS